MHDRHEVYALWQMATRNLIEDFAVEADALAAVRQMVAVSGASALADVVLRAGVRVGSRASRRSVASPRRSGSTIAPLRARTTWISQRVCPAEPSFGFHPPCGNNIRREGFHHHRRIGHASSIGVGRRETLLIMEKWWGIVPSTSGHRPLWSGLHFVAADSRAATAQPSSRGVP